MLFAPPVITLTSGSRGLLSTNQGSSFSAAVTLVKAAFNPPPPAVPYAVLSRNNPAELDSNGNKISCLKKFKSEYQPCKTQSSSSELLPCEAT